jgi:3-deoxy-manno-octulosonate cytidylyltransferase (CMP-KDO synthetase)
MSIAALGRFVTEQKNSIAVSQKALILIPARMHATRLPGKPLADIHGLPMIVHVWRRAMEANAGRVVVATDSSEILDAVEKAGGEAVMTRADHPSGSDRIHEAVMALDPQRRAGIVVNLQGDLPTLDPRLVTACIAPLSDAATDIATLAAVISEDDEKINPNVVKVVGTPIGDRRLRALYFTRATAPHGDGPLHHHIGIYAYRRESLERFVSLPQGVLERREKLEQLRALEAQMRIDVSIVDTVPLGVDTPADLERARRLITS